MEDAGRRRKSYAITYSNEAVVRAAIIEISIYLLFVVVTIIVATSSQDKYMFYLNRSISSVIMSVSAKNSIYDVRQSFEAIKTTADWWSFLEHKFLDDLHFGAFGKAELELNKTQSESAETLKFLNENLLLGPPRLRQIRVQADSCRVDRVFSIYFTSCYAAYTKTAEDTKGSFHDTKYYTMEELDASSVWGNIATYDSGGYIQDLTYNYERNKAILAELKSQQWIDRGTRLVLLEFTIYNVNTQLYDSVKFIGEFPPTGGVLTSANLQALKLSSIWLEEGYFVLLAAIIFYFMIILNAANEIREIRLGHLTRYLCSVWNILDLFVVTLASLTLIYNIWHVFYIKEFLLRIVENPEVYHSFDKICYWHMIYNDIMGICAFLVCLKIFKFISFNKTMLQFSLTVKSCSKDLLGFGVMFGIVFLAYAQLGLLLFGHEHPDFRNFKESVLTMLRMVLGDFEYSAIEKANSILGPIYFLTYILLVFFILLNMFLAIINDTYSNVRRSITFGDNHLQLFIVKICTAAYNKMCTCFVRKDVDVNSVRVVPRQDSLLDHDLGDAIAESTETEAVATPAYIRAVIRLYLLELQPETDIKAIKRLANRVELAEELMEQLYVDLNKILKAVQSKKKTRSI